jgi:hypothetical protein
MSPQMLTASMRLSTFDALNEALYGSAYGFGERVLPLELRSRTPRFFIKLPVTCRYKDDKLTLLFEKVTKPTWNALCEHVGEERTIRVILDDGTQSYDARLSLPGSEPLEDKRTEVDLRWQEYEEAVYVLKKILAWIKEKLLRR